MKQLTKRQSVFVDEYLRCFNGAEAARRAGYSESRARITASELLADSNISEQIQERLAEVHMSADEALKLTADIARGDVAQLMDVSSVGFNLDMSKAQELGLTKLIKKVKQKTTIYQAKKESEEDREVTELEIELYDSQAALRDILKLHGRFTEKLDLSNSDGTLKPEKGLDDERFDRAISTLADALRDSLSGKSPEQNSDVGPAK